MPWGFLGVFLLWGQDLQPEDVGLQGGHGGWPDPTLAEEPGQSRSGVRVTQPRTSLHQSVWAGPSVWVTVSAHQGKLELLEGEAPVKAPRCPLPFNVYASL